ncbi:MAG: carboxypeptidase regulatory-like domain-containing protein [bacterium]|nr:carboxypeptidase regulatory-like domain-containing protein [bacterium]
MKQCNGFLGWALLFALVFTTIAMGKPTKKNMLRSRLAEIELRSPLDVKAIEDAGGIFDEYKGPLPHVYLLPEDFDLLRARGFTVQWLPEVREEYPSLDEYHENAQIEAEFIAWAAAYPTLFTYQSIGNSVQGRPMWVGKVSDNATSDEPEIEVKYISSMHGDELTGLENCIKFIDTLLTGYGTDPVLTGLVNDYEIWIMPLMNPDGRDVGTLGQRFNANGADLNRDFPDRCWDSTNTAAGREIETANVMAFTAAHNFVLSANFHGGEIVENYPWDSNYNGSSVYSPSPEQALFEHLALTYSMANPTMYNSVDFEDGITNGAEWYHVSGGMQDWNYVWMGCKETTIEISHTKSGPESALDSLWNENRQSMIDYLLEAREGVRGIVTDAESGLPVRARIMLSAITYVTYSTALHGDYFRILRPGTYTLTFSAPGYVSETVNNIAVVDGTPTLLDIQLNPAPRAEIVLVPNSVAEGMETCDTMSVNVLVQNPGDLALTWSAQEKEFNNVNYGAGAGGPRWIDSRAAGGPVYAWKDISTIGTAVSFTTDDQNLGPYALGFTFPFYGTNFTQVRVCGNGWLSFTSTVTSYSNSGLPNSTSPENLLACWWDDLSPHRAGTVVRRWTNNLDSFVVSFQNVQSYQNNGLYNFEVILTSDGGITYQYGSMGVNRLTSATIGLQNSDRTKGLAVIYNGAYIADNIAIRFCPSAAVKSTPASGAVAAGGEQNLTLSLSSCCLPDGPSLSHLTFTSNAPTSPQYDLPITIDAGVAPDPTEVSDLTIIFVAGGAQLTWTAAANTDFYSIWSGTVWPPNMSNATQIGTTAATTYLVDTDLSGTEYFFVVSER